MEDWPDEKKRRLYQESRYNDHSSNSNSSHTWSQRASANSTYSDVNNRLSWKRKKRRASREPGYNDYSLNSDSSHTWSQDTAAKSAHTTYAGVNSTRLSWKRRNTRVSQEPWYKEYSSNGDSSSKIPFHLSKEFRLSSKAWKKEWGYGADFIEWKEKNNLDGAVVDLTVETESVLNGKNKCVINLIDEEDDHNNATGMFGMKKRKFTFYS